MGILSSLYTGVSGLSAQGEALGVMASLSMLGWFVGSLDGTIRSVIRVGAPVGDTLGEELGVIASLIMVGWFVVGAVAELGLGVGSTTTVAVPCGVISKVEIPLIASSTISDTSSTLKVDGARTVPDIVPSICYDKKKKRS